MHTGLSLCRASVPNWTHVRQWLGYDRLDSPEVFPLMNELYTSEWRLFLNFFRPSVKLIEKK